MKTTAILTVLALMVPGLSAASGLPVIPGAAGFGIYTTAGSGRHLAVPRTRVLKVTNLDDDGPGSFRAAVSDTGPRTVVFEVSGAVFMESPVAVDHPYLTVAGQTAPSPGIAFYGQPFWIRTHDVLVQHIRIRAGEDTHALTNEQQDCITIYDGTAGGNNTYNVVIDHCSFSWSLDENINTWSDPHDGVADIDVRYCISAEGLNLYGHSKGFLIGTSDRRILCYSNLFACNNDRNPVLNQGAKAMVVNNVAYNAKTAVIHSYPAVPPKPDDGQGTIIGNYVKPGRNSNDYAHYVAHFADYLPQYGYPITGQYYLEDNRCDNRVAGNTADCVRNDAGPSIITGTPPLWIDDLAIRPSANIYDYVLIHAGARPLDRDVVDERIINNVRTGQGTIPRVIADVGGWPVLAENTRALNIPANPTGDDDRDGYTNLEEWLHEYAAAVEPGTAARISDPAKVPRHHEEDGRLFNALTGVPAAYRTAPGIYLRYGEGIMNKELILP